MIHIVLLLNLVSLVVGSWGALYSYQIFRRFEERLFRSYTLYIIFFNGIILLTLLFLYIITNLRGEGPGTVHPVITVVGYVIDFALEIGMVYQFLRVIAALKNRSSGRRFNELFIAVVVLFAFAYGAAVAIFFIKGTTKPIEVVTSIGFMLSLLVFMISLIGLVGHRPEPKARIPTAAAKAFGWFYLAGFMLFLGAAPMPEAAQMLTVSGVYLLMNIWPLVWIHAVYLPSARHEQILLTDDAVLTQVVESYSLSKREGEILRLLLQGKTYRDIESALFISINTVRNHIHNLYQKLGVGSRARLIHFILEFKQGRFGKDSA